MWQSKVPRANILNLLFKGSHKKKVTKYKLSTVQQKLSKMYFLDYLKGKRFYSIQKGITIKIYINYKFIIN